MKKISLISIVILFSFALLQGAIYEYYIFSQATATYTPITGTPVPNVIGDDMLSDSIPIGFTFPYGTAVFSEVKVDSNGHICLGTSQQSSNLTNNLAGTTTVSNLAPLWDDTSLSGGTCQYLTEGTAPNRIFKVQYGNLQWNYFAGNQFNFQVWMHESGKVEFLYGPSSGTPSGASASIGINMVPGGINNFYSVTPGTPASSSYTNENTTITTYPGDGVKYVFDIVAPVPNDLAALSISGNTTPSEGSASIYTISIRNSGSNAQSNYSVRIMSGATVLASQPGPVIGPGEFLNVQVSWTPTTTGPMTINGNVLLTGDEYPQNDNTPPMNINVQGAGTIAVTIGAGDEQANIPVNMYWRNSLFETIYLASELNIGGLITGISFYNNFVSNLPNMPTKIWLGITQQNDLSGGWIPSTQLTQVFDGNVNYPSGVNTITIPLTTPFVYGGGNLVMMANRPMDTQYYDFDDMFACQTVGANRSLEVYDDNEEFIPSSPPANATLSGLFPKTTFYITSAGTDPEFAVSPASYNFETLLINNEFSQIFTVVNIGGGNLTLSSISIAGSPYFTLSNVPTLPITLGSLESAQFNCVFHPTEAGDFTGTITLVDDLTRTIHTVPLSGSCIDPNIYTSPYVQNFDVVTAPNIPLDWNRLISPAGTGATVSVISTGSHTPPNCARLNNQFDNTTNIFLIAPPLTPTLNLNDMRVKLWAKGNNNSTVIVGIISNITDPATFTSLETINLTTAWTEHIISLSAYTGTGRYVAFKHGNSNWFEQIDIDDVTIETIPQNDLAAVSVTGNVTPSVSAPSNYEVTIYNWGTIAQSNYNVKLFTEGDIEVASIAGTTIDSETEETFTLSWTPATAGPTYVYGKVVLAGDQNVLNDSSPNLAVVVQQEGTTAITIGSGDQLALIPVDMFYRNSLYETIFQASEIPAGGQITGIAFYNDFVTNLPNMPTKIWLGVTDQNELTTGWIPSTQLTQVFDGTIDYPSGANTITIPLQTPYPYAGTNLVMMVNRPMDTVYYSSLDRFQAQTGALNNSLKVWDDNENFDPANPPADGVPSGQYPKTTLFFVPSGPDPFFGVAPQSRDYGTVLLGNTISQTFTMFNSGGSPLTITDITFSGSTMYNLQNLPTLPMVLDSGQNASFVARYQPTAAGTHTGTITITDNLARNRTQHIVPLTGICVDATIYTSPYFQNFDAVTPPVLPIDWQRLYQPASINGFANTSSNNSHSASNSVQMYNSDSATADILLIAPPLTNTLDVTTMRVKFWARGQQACNLQVGVISDVFDASTFQSISTVALTTNWVEYIVSFQTYTGTGQNIAFRHGQSGLYQSLYIDDVTIETTPQNDLAALSISGNTTPSVGMATTYTVNVFNWGTNPQTTYTVKLFTEGDVEVASVDGPQINPGLAANVQVTWAPTAQGQTYIYGKVVLTGDQNDLNDQTPHLTVFVQPAGTMVVTIGDGSETALIPLNMFYMNSLFETMYYSTELNFIGMITGISFYNTFTTNLPNMPTNIWLAETAQTDLETGWIPSTQMTEVFSGNVDYPSGENLITIEFPTPFLYLGGNLVMMAERPMDGQYYSSADLFYTQTIGTNRSRYAWSDFEDFDPAAPPDNATLFGQFPKTSFLVIPGGVGHLTGNVYGAGDLPLANATVQIVGGAQANTDANGHYLIQNLIADDYQVSASRYGYISQTVNVTIPEDSTVTQNFTLEQMPTVNVMGQIVGSDAPTVGLSGATIALTGYENYQGTTDAQGNFTITGVYANQQYEYIASGLGYQVLTGIINVGATNYDMGIVILSEIAYTPREVAATVIAEPASVNVSWLAPDPSAIDVDQSFEDTTFPPDDWTHNATNNGPANTVGVYPTWCRVGEIISGTTTITPTDGAWQSGFWWDYNHQDEWLISPAFNCPQGASLIFDTYCFYGSLNNDHYYIKITNNGGNTWEVLWDASTETGGWNAYQTPVQISLADYTGQQVQLAWHATDPPSNDGMWYNWFIDNIQVSNTTTRMRIPVSSLTLKSASTSKLTQQPVFTTAPLTKANDALSLNYASSAKPVSTPAANRGRNRSLTGYKVWRLVLGQEQNETTWVQLTPDLITELAYSDLDTPSLPQGTYKWAVKAAYTNNVYSLAAFSNPITLGVQIMGTMTGVVRTSGNIPIMGATISAGSFTATTNASGVYAMQVAVGTYDVTCTADGYPDMVNQNVVVNEGQTTVCNFIVTGIEEEVLIVRTELKGNYPNPFNPETVIAFDVKGVQPVKIEIYNTKGQFIRTLVNEVKNNGHHSVIWNGKDEHGKAVASGIYHYRMQAGDYKANRRMMLLK